MADAKNTGCFDYLDRWFFTEIDIKQYALLRIGIGLLILIYLMQLYPLAVIHFSDEGWSESKAMMTNYQSLPVWTVLYFLTGALQVQVFFLIAMLFAACFSAGIYARFSGLMTWIALVSLWHRNPFILDGDDAILRLSLFYLLFSPCGAAYSLQRVKNPMPTTAPIWSLRLIQIQLALVYFVSGWSKFNSPAWMDGTILYLVLQHPQYSRWHIFPWIETHQLTWIIFYLSCLICWWELLFPLLLCQRVTRIISVYFGLTFHVGLLVFMHLRLFPIIMLVLYIAYIPNHWFSKSGTIQKLRS